MIKMHIFFT